MNEWISSVLNAEQAGLITIAAVFLLGAISVLTCACNFAAIGTVTGYAGTVSAAGKRKVIVSSGCFLLGSVTALSIIGYLIGFAGELVNVSMGNYWKIAAGVIAIFFGVYTLDILPFKLRIISPTFQSKKNSVMGAVLFGFFMGGAISFGSLCCNPILPIVMGASFLKGSTIWGFTMLFFYALGYGVTLAAAMLGIGLGLGKISNPLSKVGTFIKYAGGIILIALGFYYLITF